MSKESIFNKMGKVKKKNKGFENRFREEVGGTLLLACERRVQYRKQKNPNSGQEWGWVGKSHIF